MATPAMSLPCFPINTGETKRTREGTKREQVRAQRRANKEREKKGEGEGAEQKREGAQD